MIFEKKLVFVCDFDEEDDVEVIRDEDLRRKAYKMALIRDWERLRACERMGVSNG